MNERGHILFLPSSNFISAPRVTKLIISPTSNKNACSREIDLTLYLKQSK